MDRPNKRWDLFEFTDEEINSFNIACEVWEKREKELLEKIKKHYYCYGYEKQHYLKELLEEYLETKLEVD